MLEGLAGPGIGEAGNKAPCRVLGSVILLAFTSFPHG